MTAEAPEHHRRLRSFVRREGRMTDAQQRALDDLLHHYGVPDHAEPLDPPALFGRHAPLILEIGFGDGESLAALAAAHPDRDYLGVEVHRPGVGRLLNRIRAEGLDNVRVSTADAVVLMEQRLAPASLTGIQLYFPDPWPKKRHHKRRLVQPPWVELAASRLVPGGWLHLATDWQDYAEHMIEVMEASPAFSNEAGPGQYAPRGDRPATRFERRGTRRGHAVHDLVYRRRDAGDATRQE